MALFEGLTEFHPVTGAGDPEHRRTLGGQRRQHRVHLLSPPQCALVEWGSHYGARFCVQPSARTFADACPRSAYLAYIKGAQAYNEGKGRPEDVGIEAIDDYTVKYTLATPVLLSRAWSPISSSGWCLRRPSRNTATRGRSRKTSSRAARSRCRRGGRTTA